MLAESLLMVIVSGLLYTGLNTIEFEMFLF